jgi:hypothetical protein
MTPDELNDPSATWPRYVLGFHRVGEDEAECVLLHASPPDQESIEVVLIEGFRCLLSGQVIQIQRHQFRPTCEQSYL